MSKTEQHLSETRLTKRRKLRHFSIFLFFRATALSAQEQRWRFVSYELVMDSRNIFMRCFIIWARHAFFCNALMPPWRLRNQCGLKDNRLHFRSVEENEKQGRTRERERGGGEERKKNLEYPSSAPRQLMPPYTLKNYGVAVRIVSRFPGTPSPPPARKNNNENESEKSCSKEKQMELKKVSSRTTLLERKFASQSKAAFCSIKDSRKTFSLLEMKLAYPHNK